MTIEDFIKLIPPDRISERDDQIVIRDRISFEEAIIIDSGQTSKKITFQDTKFNTSVTIVGGQFNHLVLGGRMHRTANLTTLSRLSFSRLKGVSCAGICTHRKDNQYQ